MKFQLFLDTHDPDLFKKATSELGTIFYKQVSGDGVKEQLIFEIIYFSGSRVARYVGKATDELIKLCRACGFEVSTIELDEVSGTLKIIQKMECGEASG